ncbi:MAG: YggS family pyridoxal phosphate-dependent enzyme [Gammaproteobacteria bacterium]|nr:YggS family pyridoxal phosphate-dependent enzyme [Gammaproteobacteria bacterium]
MISVAANLRNVRARIAAAAAAHGRVAADVALLAVSKTHPPEIIRAAHGAGQRAFGENYVQEAVAKMDGLRDLDLEWHFIGPLQSNKSRAVAERCAWIHTVDRERIGRRLATQRPPGLGPLNVCIEVNVSGEAAKAGVAPADTLALARTLAPLPGLRLRGLMCVPAATADPARQREPFRLLAGLLRELNAAGLALDTLSMGMTADLEAAIAEGSTLVRVGTGIFGPRATFP